MLTLFFLICKRIQFGLLGSSQTLGVLPANFSRTVLFSIPEVILMGSANSENSLLVNLLARFVIGKNFKMFSFLKGDGIPRIRYYPPEKS